jgi:hypothetical protein
MLGEPCGTPCLVPEHTPTSTDHVSPDEGIGRVELMAVSPPAGPTQLARFCQPALLNQRLPLLRAELLVSRGLLPVG